ncbi:6509_t:CDS:1 [Acaulospora morrowiae]|uniref:6509_t:CDS:1 n=1 Tax=Acaulospora morrowiae TaxID=94023 RepID=A0A9N8Z9N8_9GLOM|nr:6509_t:CDS:1 [Acaulospora morrowiae]
MAPATFKITTPLPNSITRRFTTPNSTPSWSELETKIRSLFQIEPHASIGLAYTDEEGDVITFSSDAELQEIYEAIRLQAERDEESRGQLRKLQETFDVKNETFSNQSGDGNTESKNDNNENFASTQTVINSGNEIIMKFGLLVMRQTNAERDESVEDEETQRCIQQ